MLNIPNKEVFEKFRIKWTDKDMIEFAIWLRDNFSPLAHQNPLYMGLITISGHDWLPKREWRRDFTDEILDIEKLLDEFKKSRS